MENMRTPPSKKKKGNDSDVEKETFEEIKVSYWKIILLDKIEDLLSGARGGDAEL